VRVGGGRIENRNGESRRTIPGREIRLEWAEREGQRAEGGLRRDKRTGWGVEGEGEGRGI
jgi:hypothetical protein